MNQPSIAGPYNSHKERPDLNEEAVSLAAKIQKNFEGLGI
jgi:hypothetical protein